MAVFLVCAFSERPDDDCVVQPRTRLRQKDNANLMCRRVIILLLAASSLAGCSRKDDVLAIGRLTPDKGGVNGFSVPTNLGYARNPALYAIGTEIESNEPYFEGDTPTQYSVSPELPEGLTLDSTTGVLSGIPTVLAPTSDYIVTAETLAGSTQTTLTLKVASTAPFVTNGTVRAMVRSGNALYVGGDFTQIGPPTGPGVMLDVSTGTKPGFAAWPPVNGIVYGVVADPANPGGFYIGGNFTQVGTVALNGIARIFPNGRPDPSWNPNANDVVYALAVSDDGNTVFAGGLFTAVGGQARSRIAALDASTASATAWNPNALGSVLSLAFSENTVYAAGTFSSIGGQARHGLAALDASTGSATPWNPRPDDTVFSLAVSGNAVYAAGLFLNIGGQARTYLAALDAVTGTATPWNPHPDHAVWSLAVGDNTVYAGGDFRSIGGQARTYLAALDASTGSATPWNPNANSQVGLLAVSDDGSTVYVGGTWFDVIGAAPRRYVAALDASTGIVTPWNPNANGPVQSLAVSGNTVYAGGDFTAIGGETRSCLAVFSLGSDRA